MAKKLHEGASVISGAKQDWERMKLVYVGHVGEVLATGGVGKSPVGPDADAQKG